MTAVMTPPMIMAMNRRVQLKNTWSSSYVLRYIAPQPRAVDAATIAQNLG